MWGKRESLTAKVQGSRGGFAAIDEEVAAVLAFVISHTTFLAAQDDETGRCPKVVCKSPVTTHPFLLIFLPHWGRGTAQRWIGCFRKSSI